MLVAQHKISVNIKNIFNKTSTKKATFLYMDLKISMVIFFCLQIKYLSTAGLNLHNDQTFGQHFK